MHNHTLAYARKQIAKRSGYVLKAADITDEMAAAKLAEIERKREWAKERKKNYNSAESIEARKKVAAEHNKKMREYYKANPVPLVDKKCSACKKVKPPTEFNNKSGAKDGKDGRCRSCIREHKKAYRLKHLERHKQQDKERHARYHKKPGVREAQLARGVAWRENNPEKAKKQSGRRVELLTDAYVVQNMNTHTPKHQRIPAKDMPEELVDAHRKLMVLRREVKKQND